MSRSVIDTMIGPLTITAGPEGVVRIDFGPIASVDDPGPSAPADIHVQRAADELAEYFGGHRTHFTVVLDRRAREGFRGEVLTALEAVPHGETVTYGELAEMAGRPRAARAVGTAMATNPLPIVVPCHRVVRTGGVLGAYGGGVDTKAALLALEGVRLAP
jgi:methylated-DNA-[protein]-cysteine S-methyltransferase